MNRRRNPFAPGVIVRCRPVTLRTHATWRAAAVVVVGVLACLAALLQVWG